MLLFNWSLLRAHLVVKSPTAKVLHAYLCYYASACAYARAVAHLCLLHLVPARIHRIACVLSLRAIMQTAYASFVLVCACSLHAASVRTNQRG